MSRNKAKIVFMGSKSQGYRILNSLFNANGDKMVAALTMDDREDPRSHFKEINEFATSNNLDLCIANNKEETDKFFENYQPDYVFGSGWYQIISEKALSNILNGLYGLHNSLLPKYRGQSPLIWSLLNGEPNIGSSLFKIGKEMDNGAIYHQWSTPNDDSKYLEDIMECLEKTIAKDFGEICAKIVDDSLTPTPQDHAKASYCAKRIPKDSQIPWHKPMKYVYRHIRTLNDPYPASFSFIDKEKIIIKRVEPFTTPVYGDAGAVIRMNDGAYVVVCGDQQGLTLIDWHWENQKLPNKIKVGARLY